MLDASGSDMKRHVGSTFPKLLSVMVNSNKKFKEKMKPCSVCKLLITYPFLCILPASPSQIYSLPSLLISVFALL